MKLDNGKLQEACFSVAREVLWARRPVSVTEIQSLADRFYKDALSYEEFITGQNRNPNLITAAVVYLGNRHAIPPLACNPECFDDMLQVLVELCCPNQSGQSNEEPFFQELALGVAGSRADYAV